MKKPEKRDEFRAGHSKKARDISNIFTKKFGNEFRFMGITHEIKTRGNNGEANIKLFQNPDPTDTRVAYAQPYPDKDKIKKFGQAKKN